MRVAVLHSLALSLRRAAWPLLTLGLWLALASPGTRVEAGCVHDALSRSQEATGAAHFQLLIEVGAMAAPASATEQPDHVHPHDLSGLPRPCSGPSCSGSGGLPPAPTATIAPATSAWAWVGAATPSIVPGALPWPGRDERFRPVRTPRGIFHPPRAAAA